MHPRTSRFPAPHSQTIIVVSGRRHHFDATRAALRRLAPGWRVEWIADALDAMRLSLTARAELMLVDWDVGGSTGLALVRHLAHWRPDVAVMAFDEQAFTQDEWPRHVGAWGDLEAELESMLGTLEARAGRPR